VRRAPVFDASRPLVFAHRGGAKLAPENTLAAFSQGLALGADGLECDVHLSRDGVPMVIHDATLDRTTNHSGLVATLTADELAGVDAGFRFGTDGRHPFRGQGIGVPTLESVLTRFPQARVIVEIKSAELALALAVVAVVRRTDAVSRVCVGSYHQICLHQVRRALPDLATSASAAEARWTLYRSWIRWPIVPARPYVAFQVPEAAGHLTVLSPRFVRQVHQEGQVVQVWVVDRREDCDRLLAWGVDGLISDRPDVALEARDAWARR
jgi:glycerophosphoryl diester phosphodiesterase